MPHIILLIKIDGRINSLDLWQHIARYEVNLTDLEDFAYIYGKTNLNDAMAIIRICALYGNLHIELSEPH